MSPLPSSRSAPVRPMMVFESCETLARVRWS